MAKPDWAVIQKQFLADHAKTNISPKDWCEAHGYHYTTARRYIKKPAQRAQKTAQLCARRNPVPLRTAQSDDRRKKTNHPPFRERNSMAVKHGGYAKYMPEVDELFADAQALVLHHELLFVRARCLHVTQVLGKLRKDFDDAQDAEAHTVLAKQMNAAEQALDRNIARIESLERTLSTLDIDAAMLPKIAAETDFRRISAEKVQLEVAQLGKALNQAGRHDALEDDYQLQVLTPDEPTPEKPIL